MAPQVTQLFLCLFLIFFLVPSNICLMEIEEINRVKLSPFEFLKNLQGNKKGDHVKELHHLQKYLNQFGYLESLDENDEFDDDLEFAIITYQLNYNLNITGVIDFETVSKMSIPRCGMPDIINGTNNMYHHGSNPFHIVSHYSFFKNFPKWPKTLLTYGFKPGFPIEFMPAIGLAFYKWAGATNFEFLPTFIGDQNADLHIAFVSGDHGDNAPFDGPGGVLAHASPPTFGQFHLDATEPWSIGAAPEKIDMISVAMHEIGHLLGLEHSKVEAAVMYPYIGHGVDKTTLNEDDIAGIRALYGL